jgi:hypothetical protein
MLRSLGYKLVQYSRPGFWRGEGIAICYKEAKYDLLNTDYVNMDDLDKVYPSGSAFRYGNQAMFC